MTMRFCYADPPYIGQAHRYPEKTEVDHEELIAHLNKYYPDGWALSLSSTTLKQVLAMCPDDVRVMAWVKPWASFKPNVNPAYAWEPVIVRGGRPRGRDQLTIRDWIPANITMQKGLVGAKPPEFCHWILHVLNVQWGDEFIDLYPGTGAMTEAFRQFITNPNWLY